MPRGPDQAVRAGHVGPRTRATRQTRSVGVCPRHPGRGEQRVAGDVRWDFSFERANASQFGSCPREVRSPRSTT